MFDGMRLKMLVSAAVVDMTVEGYTDISFENASQP